jgi:ADP-ribose pyrophosphatase YjhB (NUDIX family)
MGDLALIIIHVQREYLGQRGTKIGIQKLKNANVLILRIRYLMIGLKKLVGISKMEYTLIFIFKHDLQHVLLVDKKKGPYIDMLNGVGGKLDSTDNSPRDGALREVDEETGFLESDFQTFDRLLTASYPSGTVLHVFYGRLRDIEGLEFAQKEIEPLGWWYTPACYNLLNMNFAGEGGPAYFIRASIMAME